MFPGWVVASSQRGGLIINIVDENTLNQNWNDCVAKLSRVCCSWPSTRRAFKLPVSLPDLRLLLIGLFLWSNVCNHASATPFEVCSLSPAQKGRTSWKRKPLRHGESRILAPAPGAAEELPPPDAHAEHLSRGLRVHMGSHTATSDAIVGTRIAHMHKTLQSNSAMLRNAAAPHAAISRQSEYTMAEHRRVSNSV